MEIHAILIFRYKSVLFYHWKSHFDASMNLMLCTNNNLNRNNNKIFNVSDGSDAIKNGKTNNRISDRNIYGNITNNNVPPMVKMPSFDDLISVTTTNKCTANNKPIYECQICHKTFKYNSNLISHRRIHRNDCPKCHFCGKKVCKCIVCRFIY